MLRLPKISGLSTVLVTNFNLRRADVKQLIENHTYAFKTSYRTQIEVNLKYEVTNCLPYST